MAVGILRMKYRTYKVCFLLMALITIISIRHAITNNKADVRLEPIPNRDERPHFVFGILTPHMNRDQRDAQRNTWISTILNLDKEMSFRITYKFLIDQPTNETITENNMYKDIVYLNVTHFGRAVKFGEKLYVWFKYINTHYPDALLGAKIDDDAFLCVPQLLYRLYNLRSPKLYYGWAHGSGGKVSIDRRIDEMFVVLGRELIDRIAQRKYCGERKCTLDDDLVDTNYGGTSLGQWLSIYDDIDFQPDNKRIVHFGKGQQQKYTNLIKEDFCKTHLLFHKSSVTVMHTLHTYNKKHNDASDMFSMAGAVSGNMFSMAGAVSGNMFSGEASRQLPLAYEFTNMSYVSTEDDDTMTCDHWAVVTTIFAPSKAIFEIASLTDWCLLIVADFKTPSKDMYIKDIARKGLKYLTTEEQNRLYPVLSNIIPFNHFGRKNIGYMYAIHHKAKVIWDFDDDNIGIVNVTDFTSGYSYVTACNEFKNNALNPYPYFGSKESRIWPRGFPLQHIKNKTTVPELCKVKQQLEIGVIQSLANVQPDVDAIYRLTREVPFNFKATRETHNAIVLPRHVYAPFNAQATMWFSTAFAWMPLPISVNGRVSDIWRSYIGQHCMLTRDIRVAFSAPYVMQDRNPHTLIRDFNAELDLFTKSKQLIDFLSSSKHRNIVETYGDLYRRNYLEEADLRFIDAWQKTFNIVTNQQDRLKQL